MSRRRGRPAQGRAAQKQLLLKVALAVTAAVGRRDGPAHPAGQGRRRRPWHGDRRLAAATDQAAVHILTGRLDHNDVLIALGMGAHAVGVSRDAALAIMHRRFIAAGVRWDRL